jgi:hypothetical protein
MHAIQSFLIVVLCGFVWLTIMLSLILAEEITIFDKDWRVKERIQDGTIYEMSRQGAKVAKAKRIPSEDFPRPLWS